LKSFFQDVVTVGQDVLEQIGNREKADGGEKCQLEKGVPGEGGTGPPRKAFRYSGRRASDVRGMSVFFDDNAALEATEAILVL